MVKTAIVTGAGSGVGRAIALALIRRNWKVGIVGRRKTALEETANLAGRSSSFVLVCPCDIGRAEAVALMRKKVLARFGRIEVLVNAAGTNVPRRSLELLSAEDYHEMINSNLHGSYYCVQAFLPGMRAHKSGTIINIVSAAGKQASAKSGPGYVISKFGQTGLTQSINAEERNNGIRACAIFPGDIATPLLDKRPNPPPAEAREKMLLPEDVAACALLAIDLPPRAIVEEIVIQPR